VCLASSGPGNRLGEPEEVIRCIVNDRHKKKGKEGDIPTQSFENAYGKNRLGRKEKNCHLRSVKKGGKSQRLYRSHGNSERIPGRWKKGKHNEVSTQLERKGAGSAPGRSHSTRRHSDIL